MSVKVMPDKINTDNENSKLKPKKKFKFSAAKFISMLMAGVVIAAAWGCAFYYLFDIGGKDSIFGPGTEDLAGKVIVLDAGGGVATSDKLEQPYLGSTDFVSAYSEGVVNGKVSEEEINLAVVRMLKTKLEESGASVYLTRDDKFSNITNIEKAEFANTVSADLLLEVFCRWSENESASGVSIAVPSEKYVDSGAYEKSNVIAENLLKDIVSKTKAQNLGIIEKEEYTEFNWTTVPAVRVLIGNLNNGEESKKLTDDQYQNLIVEGIVDGLARYFSE